MSRTKIIRRPDFAGGGITPDEQILLDAHARMWIKRIMRTDPIEPEKIIPAIKRLYSVADLSEPVVVIARSPLEMAIIYGISAGLLHLRNGATISTDAATRAATRAATDAVTRAATEVATDAATDAVTDAVTWAATRAATRAATDAVTRAATDAVTRAATDAVTRAATDAVTDAVTRAKFIVLCINRWINAYHGGAMWGQYDSYLTAARDVLGLRLPSHDKYSAWEESAIHGGFRCMHEKFCVVSDFPLRLLVDEQNRPHCADGPSHLWRDGFAIHHWHGVRVPAHVIERPSEITIEQIDAEKNAEVRRVMLERFGWDRYLLDSGTNPISTDAVGTLYRKEIDGDEPLVMVRVMNSTPELDGSIKPYMLRVPPTIKTAREAIAWTFGLKEKEYQPSVQT